jgi:hypothetical protein
VKALGRLLTPQWWEAAGEHLLGDVPIVWQARADVVWKAPVACQDRRRRTSVRHLEKISQAKGNA